MSLLRKWLRNDLVVRVPDELDTSEGDTPVAVEFAKMTTALREEMEAAKWRRAKEYIKHQIQLRQFGIESGYISETSESMFRFEINLLESILRVTENDVPTKP